ncbi:hypothetical protein THF1D04_20305 [Vibrio owensii]|uniref:Transposase n=1 Tax=Vibrio owensii TaxID=696485 RepID=A0AAU9Q468_9VIBR|nr:hypothetical protein THF1D04_20305 [Vibrio owensii]
MTVKRNLSFKVKLEEIIQDMEGLQLKHTDTLLINHTLLLWNRIVEYEKRISEEGAIIQVGNLSKPHLLIPVVRDLHKQLSTNLKMLGDLIPTEEEYDD